MSNEPQSLQQIFAEINERLERLERRGLGAVSTGGGGATDLLDADSFPDNFWTPTELPKFIDGFFTGADGLAKFVTDFFQGTIGLAKFVDNLFADSAGLAKFAAGLFTADAAGRGKFEPQFVDTALIKNLAVDNAKIANATIQDAKIVNLNAEKIDAGYLSVDSLEGGTIKAGKLYGGSVMADRIDSTRLRTDIAIITGAAMIASAIIGNAHIIDLNATKINAGHLSADRIDTGSLHADKLTAGTITTSHIATGTLAFTVTDATFGTAAFFQKGTLILTGEAITGYQLDVGANSWINPYKNAIEFRAAGNESTKLKSVQKNIHLGFSPHFKARVKWDSNTYTETWISCGYEWSSITRNYFGFKRVGTTVYAVWGNGTTNYSSQIMLNVNANTYYIFEAKYTKDDKIEWWINNSLKKSQSSLLPQNVETYDIYCLHRSTSTLDAKKFWLYHYVIKEDWM